MSTRALGEPEELFRPRIGRRFRDPDRAPSTGSGFRRHARKAGGRSRIAVSEPPGSSRRCAIKSKYVQIRAGDLSGMKRHLAYLERDGVERDGSPGRLYGPDDGFAADAFRARLDGEQRQFRFIVSPEDGDEVDLKEFARQLMTQVESDLGRRLIWAAVNHHNTDNPHVHIDVRGVDVDGDDLRIDADYIKHQMRWRAQEILTRELGLRTELEYSRVRDEEIGRERFTVLDRFICDHVGPDGTVTLRKLLARPGPEGRNCVARLKTLEQFKLAVEKPSGVWRLADGWKESLASLGERSDRLERLYPIVGERAIDYRVVDPKLPMSAFEGVVVGKGLHDELSGQMFAALQGPDEKGFYVPLRPEVAEALFLGEKVRVGFKTEPWVKPADRIVARAAQENGGVYDPRRHQQALENLPSKTFGPGDRSPADSVRANIVRLERLARYRLASQLPDGRWQVATDLIAQLESRERTHPRHLLHIEKVRPPERERVAAPVTDSERERLALGQAAAASLGLAFVPNPPGFRGRMVPSPSGPSRTEYVRVVDEGRRQFTLVRKPKDAERLRGRVVAVSRDHAGRLSIRTSPEISR
jgi:hypothetical protein